MSVDREYRIKVYTESAGSGAQQAAQDLKDVGKAGEQAGEGMKLFETHGREFHKLLGLLDQILPGTGLLLKAAFNPATLGIGALVLLIEQVRGAIERYNQKLEEAGEAAAKADFASGIEAAINVTRTAIEEQEKYIENLNEIERGEHGITSELNNQLQLIAAIAAAQQAQLEAKKTLDLAKLKEKQVFGEITESEAIMEKGAIEEKYIRDKRAADERKFQEEQAARQKAASEAGNKQTELNKKEAEAADILTKSQAHKAKTIKDRPADEDIKKAQDESDATRKDLDELLKAKDEGYDDPDTWQSAKDEAQAKFDAANARARDLNTLKQRAIAAEANLLLPEQDAVKNAKKAAQDNATAAAAARDEANNAQRTHDQTSGYRDSKDSQDIETDQSNVRAELFQRTKKLQKDFQTQSTVMTTQDAIELLDAIRQMGDSFSESMDTHPTKAQMKAEIAALKRLIESKGK